MTIYELRELLDDVATFKGNHTKTAIFRTGGFDGLYDYDAGILEIGIVQASPVGLGLIYIATVDDGVWQAYGPPITEELQQQLVDLFNSYEGTLPSEEQLNLDLRPFGLYGVNTG